MIKEGKKVGKCRDEKKKRHKKKIKIKLQEIKQKLLAKEVRLKGYRERIQNTNKTGHSKTTKRNFTNKWGEMTRKHTNNRMQEKTNNFGNQENLTKKPNGYATWQKYKKESKKVQKWKCTSIYSALKNIKQENAAPWWNSWILVVEIHPHSRQTSTRNEHMFTRSIRTRIDDPRKDRIDPEGPPQRKLPKRLQTRNLPTEDVENIINTNKGRDLLLTNKP